MVRCRTEDKKRKSIIVDEEWMNVPRTFPSVSARDLSEEDLVIEAEIEGYLVRRIHVDEEASIEIMYEHCFNNLHPSIKARMTKMQTTLSRFSRKQVKPLGKVELDTKDIAEMQSPKTWGQMQSLSGKLASLNRFLSQSAEKSLPFFETLKNITKENKDDYCWTKEAEKAF
ncbi:hypothetical protein Tco_0373597 [Tanacetum coccineum]